MNQGQLQRFEGVFMLDGLRMPMVAAEVDRVITGNMAPGGFEPFCEARHIGLYRGVPHVVPALNVQPAAGPRAGLTLADIALDHHRDARGLRSACLLHQGLPEPRAHQGHRCA